jgi:hypothetical protein
VTTRNKEEAQLGITYKESKRRKRHCKSQREHREIDIIEKAHRNQKQIVQADQ